MPESEETYSGDGISVKRRTDALAAKLDSLPPGALDKILKSVRSIVPEPRRTRYMPPTLSPKQEAFLSAPQEEVLYGGAAGGGKTAALVLAALQYVDLSNYHALILRRTFAELEMPGATLDLCKQWLAGTDAKWREGKKWVFPSGATLSVGYLARDDDKWQYGSANYDYIAFDEAAEFPQEETYQFLFSRLRQKAESQIPLRMRLGANPIGPGAAWLKRRFIVSKDPNRLYIPARLDDNPYINKETYRVSLSKLPPYIRIALENGDWDAKPPGKMFRREWFQLQRVMPSSLYTQRVRFWDLAATQEDKKKNPSWTCGCRMSYDNNLFIIEDVRRIRETPGQVKELVKQTAELDGTDVEIWIEQEPGSSGIAVIDDYIRTLPRFVVRPFKASGAKETRAAPFASQAEAKNVRMIEAPWNEAYLEEMEQFPSGNWKNDQVDASAGAYNVLAEKGEFSEPIGYGERTQPDWNF